MHGITSEENTVVESVVVGDTLADLNIEGERQLGEVRESDRATDWRLRRRMSIPGKH